MKIFWKLSIALIPAVLFSSCLEETFPTDRATIEQVGESPVAIEAMVRGISAALIEPGPQSLRDASNSAPSWSFGLPAIHIATESMTGDLVIANADMTGRDHFGSWGTARNLNLNDSRTELMWHLYWGWIMIANDLIAAIDEDPQEETLRAYKGMAHGLRAKCYLDLVRLYEFKENKYTSAPDALGLGVPIVTEETSGDDAKDNPRVKVEQNYELIFSDLDMAEVMLAKYDFTKVEITLPVIYGLQARAYLERGTAGVAGAFAKAEEYARKAITASKCTPLTYAQWKDPKTGFNSRSSNSSWMWCAPQAADAVTNLRNWTAHMSSEEDWTTYGKGPSRAINPLLYAKIPDNDFRKYSWLDPDFAKYESMYESTRTDAKKHFSSYLKPYAHIKFRPGQGDYINYKTGNATDFLLMRVEEMYFIEAEAAAHTDLAKGKRLLNEFMELRYTLDVPDTSPYDCSDITTVEAFTEELMIQKRIEFWGEGILLYDFKRLAISNSRGYKGTNSPALYRFNHEGRAPYWNYVIPAAETLNNRALDGYNNPNFQGELDLWTGEP